MNYNKRILKTGALAVAVTIAFGIFAYRAAEWTKGLNSEFLVLGQSGGTGSGGGSTGTTGTATTTTRIIPQVAVGSFDGNLSKYSTVIQIVNTGTTAATVTGTFYNEQGAASTLTLATNATPATFTGTTSSVSVNANSSLVISGGTTTATTPSTGSVGWGKIVYTGTVSISTFFELRDSSTGALYSRVGVAASPADMSKFVIPRVRDVASGLYVAFALVNSGSTSANYTATLRDASGTTVKAQTGALAAGAHTALFTNQFFALTNEASGRLYHSITFESTSPAFAAIALAFEGATQTSFPVDRLQ